MVDCLLENGQIRENVGLLRCGVTDACSMYVARDTASVYSTQFTQSHSWHPPSHLNSIHTVTLLAPSITSVLNSHSHTPGTRHHICTQFTQSHSWHPPSHLNSIHTVTLLAPSITSVLNSHSHTPGTLHHV